MALMFCLLVVCYDRSKAVKRRGLGTVDDRKFVVMAGIYTIKAFPSFKEAMAFAMTWPDDARVVERGDDDKEHRTEWWVQKSA